MAHGDARGRKWSGNWRMEWVASTLTLPRNMVYAALLTLMRTPRLPVVDWTDSPADLNGLVCFAERHNLVSLSVPSRFKRSLPHTDDLSLSSFDAVLPALVCKQHELLILWRWKQQYSPKRRWIFLYWHVALCSTALRSWPYVANCNPFYVSGLLVQILIRIRNVISNSR